VVLPGPGGRRQSERGADGGGVGGGGAAGQAESQLRGVGVGGSVRSPFAHGDSGGEAPAGIGPLPRPPRRVPAACAPKWRVGRGRVLVGLVGMVKAGSGRMTWTAWVQSQPCSDADYLLC
jgi:hypothetical protein